jgi:hypothetical protein
MMPLLPHHTSSLIAELGKGLNWIRFCPPFSQLADLDIRAVEVGVPLPT